MSPKFEEPYEDTSAFSPHNDNKAAPTRKLPMPQYWRQTVGGAVEQHDGIARVASTLFNRHLTELREKYTDDEIRAGFRAFARAVRSGMVDVGGKTAWLVFMGRREQWIHRAEPKKLTFNAHPQQRMRLGAKNDEPPG